MARWTDIADWRGPVTYHGGTMSEYRGLVIHIAEGYFEGTIAWMSSPSNTAMSSAHFVVSNGAKGQGFDGQIAQTLDTSVVAYTQQDGNGHWLSVECAGFAGERLTTAQMRSVARLLAKAHTTYGVPLQIATSASGRGLGHHSMGGTAWGHLDCPGNPIIAQKAAILAMAQEIVEGEEMPTVDEIVTGILGATITQPGVVWDAERLPKYDELRGLVTTEPLNATTGGVLGAMHVRSVATEREAAEAARNTIGLREQIDALSAKVDALGSSGLVELSQRVDELSTMLGRLVDAVASVKD